MIPELCKDLITLIQDFSCGLVQHVGEVSSDLEILLPDEIYDMVYLAARSAKAIDNGMDSLTLLHAAGRVLLHRKNPYPKISLKDPNVLEAEIS